MSFVFPPKGWSLCDGQLFPINQNQALFSLLGTVYGGDGRVNFGLPNLQGRTPIHVGNGHILGERGGEQAHTISIGEMPTHTHAFQANTGAGDTATPNATVLAKAPATTYAPPIQLVAMSPVVGNRGGSQAHQNMQPFLTLSFCIALQGIFPSQN